MQMEITVNKTNGEKSKVRYAVHYKDRNYEYALHSSKRFFMRNIADVVNVIEYCVTQDLKKNGYVMDDSFYDFKVIRLVNDIEDGEWDGEKFKGIMNQLVAQIAKDNIQRNV